MALTGHFKMFLMILGIIMIHEGGHILMALILKWKITKVSILPFGALTVFDEDINRPVKEEALIAISGPLVQLFFTFFVFKGEMISYSLAILFFNLLPIYPLDGAKFLNLFLNKIMSFRLSLIATLYFSVICLFFLVVKCNFNLLFILIVSFILVRVIDEICKVEVTFNRFLLEKEIKNFNFKKLKVINGLNVHRMRRDFRHIFKVNGYKTEKEILKEMFDFKGKL